MSIADQENCQHALESGVNWSARHTPVVQTYRQVTPSETSPSFYGATYPSPLL
ncbi:hypothetical protein PISMIDRAFT_671686 [Pisolithus microcarpus 441]|uniref:Uncharacterized protein n=1 Tax=Pisolithus microcarpus 441 TaxID=765257 RepID=A0A0C9ZK85_9AGAM|nr:hypothetical protein PISMIDRAFT_671686 [Pisolithus microcarpus 441]